MVELERWDKIKGQDLGENHELDFQQTEHQVPLGQSRAHIKWASGNAFRAALASGAGMRRWESSVLR